MKRKHWLVCLALVLAGIVVAAVLFLTGWFVRDTLPPGDAAEVQVPIPRYREIPVGFEHRYDGEASLPFTGAAWIDVDGDGLEELFLGGGAGQPDALLRYEAQGLSPMPEPFIIHKNGDAATYGAASIDADGDGRVDLFVNRADGLWFHRNTQVGFQRNRVDAHLNERTVGLSLALADLNHDGWVDLYISGYIKPELVAGLTIFNDHTYGGSSRLLINNGDNTFRDGTEASGLEYVHNTFQALFVDADGDRDQDLIVAHDTGQVRTYRNLEAEGSPLEFEMVTNPTTNTYAYPMGIAVGDSNGDGLPDFLFPNTGTTIPDFIAKGDLENDQTLNVRWIFFRTGPHMTFEDVAEETRVAGYEFGWGAVFADMNLDGREDIVAAENFVDFPPHKLAKLPGRYLLQNADDTFAPAGKAAGAENPHYGISPLVGDVNGDGEPDLLHLNIEGPTRLLASEGTLEARSLRVEVPDTPAFQNARVVLTLEGGERRFDWFVGSEGLAVDQPAHRLFGLAEGATASELHLELADGRDCVIASPGEEIRVTAQECS